MDLNKKQAMLNIITQAAHDKKHLLKSLRLLPAIAGCLFVIGIPAAAISQSIQDAMNAMRNEQPAKAKNILLHIIAKTPADPEACYRLGNIYYSLGKKDSAAFYYRQGTKPEDKVNYNFAGLAKVALDEKNEPQAQDYLNKLTGSGKSRDPKAYIFAADAYFHSSLNDAARALPLLERAVSLNIKNVEAQLLIAEVYLSLKNAGKAVTSYEYALEADPALAFAHMKIAKIFMSARNYELAHEHLKKGNQADPAFIPLYRELAEFYYLAKNYGEAVRLQKIYIEKAGSTIDNLSSLAKYLFMNRDYQNTVSTIQTIMQQDSSNVILTRLIGYSAFEEGKYQEGLAFMERFFQKADSSKILGSDYAYYGKLLAKNNKDSLAIIYLNKAISLDSTNADLYNDLALVLYSQKKYQQSAAVFEKMLTLRSGTSQDYFQFAKACYYSNNFAKADSAFIKVTEMQPASPTGYLWRARSNSQLDPESEKGFALPFYLKFIELATDETKYKKDLLEAYSYLGYYYAIITQNMTEAKKAWKKVQELDPENPKAKEFFKQLNTPPSPPKN